MSEGLLQCYNKGCGQKYNPDENTGDVCQYHPGGPVFHDAMKGWSCCKKRSTDFTQFLNTPGCTSGPHTNVKPPEPEKPSQNADKDGTDAAPAPQEVVKPPVRMERPSDTEAMKRLKVNVGASLKTALDKHMKELSLNPEQNKATDTSEVKPGVPCQNASCKASYKDESSDSESCQFHPGVPIFHEGMKYWTCCQRKTSDFNAFLSQEGCETGKHLWVKKEPAETKVACRMDWHQTGSFVTMSIFAKVALPEKSWVDVNKVSAKINIVFEGGKSQYQKNIKLHGIIDPEASNVKMLGTKVEVNFKKMEPGHWKNLEQSETTS